MTFLKQASWLSGTQIVGLLLTLASRVIMARMLGSANFGAFGAATNAMSVSSRVLSMGTASGSQYFASKLDSDRQSVVGTSLVLAFFVGFISLGITAWAMPHLTQFFFASHPGGAHAVMVLAWAMPVIVVSMNLGVMLIPFRQVKAYSLIQLFNSLSFLGLFAGLQMAWPPMTAAIYAQFGVWAANLVLVLWCLRSDLRGAKWDSGVAKELTTFGVRSWPNVCLNIGIASFSTLFAARYLNPVELSIFVLAMNIVEGLFAPHLAIGQLLLTKTARSPLSSGPKVLRFLRVSLIGFSVLCLLLWTFGGWVIPWVFGRDYAASHQVALGLFVCGISHAMMKAIGNVFSGLGNPSRATVALSAELLCFAALLPLLGSAGIWGVVAASSIAAILGWIICARQVCHQFQVSVVQLVWPQAGDFHFRRRTPPIAPEQRAA